MIGYKYTAKLKGERSKELAEKYLKNKDKETTPKTSEENEKSDEVE